VLAVLLVLLLSSSAVAGGAIWALFCACVTSHQQEVDAVLSQHIHELERSFKQSLDSRHLSSMAAAAAATAAGGGSSATAAGSGGGPGGARGLTIPAPGAAGSWQVSVCHLWDWEWQQWWPQWRRQQCGSSGRRPWTWEHEGADYTCTWHSTFLGGLLCV
jgi:hypothetical protein